MTLDHALWILGGPAAIGSRAWREAAKVYQAHTGNQLTDQPPAENDPDADPVCPTHDPRDPNE